MKKRGRGCKVPVVSGIVGRMCEKASALADRAPGPCWGDLPDGGAGSPSWKSMLGSRCIPAVYVLVCGALRRDAPGRRVFCMVVCVV